MTTEQEAALKLYEGRESVYENGMTKPKLHRYTLWNFNPRNPIEIISLAMQGFDMFGLIDAGFAKESVALANIPE